MALWVIDDLINENAYPGVVSLAEAAKSLGHDVLRTKYVPFSNADDFSSHYDYKLNGKKVSSSILQDAALMKMPTIVHGTVEFCKVFERCVGRQYTPGLYFNKNVKHFSRFAAHLGHVLLNREFSILPFRHACRECFMSYFIKPESGLKEFTGQVVNFSSMSEQDVIKQLCPHSSIDPETLVVISQPKQIKAEFRYVIVDKKVVAGSEYRWENVLDVRSDTHPVCTALAEHVAQAEWQADRVYVCDIALLPDDTARVIELNAFSSSGLYACDPYTIVQEVSTAAKKEAYSDE